MKTKIENAIHVFPNLERAYEVSLVSGLMIKPFHHTDYHPGAALSDVKASGALHRMSESGEILVELVRPQFSELFSSKKHETPLDIETRLEDLRSGDLPNELESPGAAKLLLQTAWEKLCLSLHDYNMIMLMAGSIARLDDSAGIKTEHIAEAIHYRALSACAGQDVKALKL